MEMSKTEQLPVIELTEIMPYMDERELTDEVLEEIGFTKVDMTIEETGENEGLYYYELELFPDNINGVELALLSDTNNETKVVSLYPYENPGPEFKTAGGIKTLLMAMQGE